MQESTQQTKNRLTKQTTGTRQGRRSAGFPWSTSSHPVYRLWTVLYPTPRSQLSPAQIDYKVTLPRGLLVWGLNQMDGDPFSCWKPGEGKGGTARTRGPGGKAHSTQTSSRGRQPPASSCERRRSHWEKQGPEPFGSRPSQSPSLPRVL